MASLVKQHGLYYGQFYSSKRSPNRKRVPLKTRRKKTARKVLTDLEEKWALGEYNPWRGDELPSDAPRTIREALPRFYEAKAHLSPATVKKYQEILRPFVRALPEGYGVREVTAEHIKRWLEGTSANDVTQHTYVGHIRTFFRWCIDKGYAENDPTQGVNLKRVPKKFPKFLSPEEVEQILQTIDEKARSAHWLKDVIRVTVHTGLRRGEVINLRWRDVDLENRRLVVSNTEDFRTKNGKDRKVPLSETPYETLRRMKNDSSPTPPRPRVHSLQRLHRGRLFE